MLEISHRDGRARIATWKPSEASGGAKPAASGLLTNATAPSPATSTPTLAWPQTFLAAAPAWASVHLTSDPAAAIPPGHIRILAGGTWFHPLNESPPGSAVLVPATAPQPTTKVQTISAGDELAVLHDAAGWATNPAKLLAALIESRTAATPGRLLWAAGVGTPQDYALWIYLGVDLFDASPLLLAAARGQLLTVDGALSGDAAAAYLGLDPETPLPTGEAGASQLAAHNAEQARRELELVRHHIREGTLRGLAERRAYGAPWMVELLRRADREHAFLEATAPRLRTRVDPVKREAVPVVLPCMTAESLWMPEVEAFRRRFRDDYVPPSVGPVPGMGPDILVLLPCSARKPYKLSRSHKHYQRILDESGIRHRIHEVMVTSPLGLVPRELEELYPANAYDIPVTGHWLKDEEAIVRTQVESLLAKGKYTHVVSHVGAHTLDAFRDLMPAGTVETVANHPTTPDDLARLAAALAAIKAQPRPSLAAGAPGASSPSVTGRDRKLRDLAALASFQFGPTIAAELVAGADTEGRLPFLKLVGPEGQRGMTTPERGQLSLTIHGATILARHGVGRVHLKPFELRKTSALFAVGVADCDPGVRPGDEVAIVQDGRVVGCGGAMMASVEMRTAKRGVACSVRHLETAGPTAVGATPAAGTPPKARPAPARVDEVVA